MGIQCETDRLKKAEIVKSWFGSTLVENLAMNPQFVTDYGVNIHIGEISIQLELDHAGHLSYQDWGQRLALIVSF